MLLPQPQMYFYYYYLFILFVRVGGGEANPRAFFIEPPMVILTPLFSYSMRHNKSMTPQELGILGQMWTSTSPSKRDHNGPLHKHLS